MEETKDSSRIRSKTSESIVIDATDLRLLDRLQEDAALTNEALAALVHISPATCLRRVKRLVERGVIERRVALIAAEKCGPSLTAIVEVTLDRQGSEAQAAFEVRAVAERAVLQCHRVSPGPDFVLTVQVADMPAYHALVQRLFTEDANVRNVKSFFSKVVPAESGGGRPIAESGVGAAVVVVVEEGRQPGGALRLLFQRRP